MGNQNSVSSKTESWPSCCRTEHTNQTFFNFKQSSEQTKATQWIQRSLEPSYKPCRKCAKDITRRYNDHNRKIIMNKINWSKYQLSELREMFGLPASLNNISIKNLSLENGEFIYLIWQIVFLKFH